MARQVIREAGCAGIGSSGRGGRSCRARCRAVAVVVAGVLVQDVPEVAFTEDQQPVGQFGPGGAEQAVQEARRRRRPWPRWVELASRLTSRSINGACGLRGIVAREGGGMDGQPVGLTVALALFPDIDSPRIVAPVTRWKGDSCPISSTP
jgi:hypothetical protein